MTQLCVFLAITFAYPFPMSELLVCVCKLRVCNLCKFANFTGARSRFFSYVKVSVLFLEGFVNTSKLDCVYKRSRCRDQSCTSQTFEMSEIPSHSGAFSPLLSGCEVSKFVYLFWIVAWLHGWLQLAYSFQYRIFCITYVLLPCGCNVWGTEILQGSAPQLCYGEKEGEEEQTGDK